MVQAILGLVNVMHHIDIPRVFSLADSVKVLYGFATALWIGG
jgi:hypothetical protein